MQIKDKVFASWLADEKEKLTHPRMICDWFLENQDRIMHAANMERENDRVDTWGWAEFKPGDRYTRLSMDYYHAGKPEAYILNVPNTHRCPDNGVSNFGNKPDLPRGYPGWQVKISGKLERDKKNMSQYPYAAGLNVVGLKTGSGGGGNDNWMYEVSIFLDDWPGFKPLAAQLEQDELFKKLKGRYVY